MTRLLPNLLFLLLAATALAEPLLAVDLTADRSEVWEGEVVTITATVTSTSRTILPARLEIHLPDGLDALATPIVSGGVSAQHPRHLVVQARATRRGEHRIRATAHTPAEPEASAGTTTASAERMVLVRKPATLDVRASPATSYGRPGDTATFEIHLENVGDAAAHDVRLSTLITGENPATSDEPSLDLAPGATHTFTVRRTIPHDATSSFTIRVSAEHENDRVQAEATIDVRHAEAVLEQAVNPTVAVPGQAVHATLRVHNPGTAPLEYELRAAWPEWMVPDPGAPARGVVPPGGTITHQRTATVRFGAPSSGDLTTTLSSPTRSVEAVTSLARDLVHVTLDPELVTTRAPGDAAATLTLRNPSTSELAVQLQTSLPVALAATKLPEPVVLAAGASATFPITLTTSVPGTHRYEVTAFHDGSPAAFPTGVDVQALEPLRVERRSTLALPFQAGSEKIDAVLLAHALPRGSAYVPGSSRLDDQPLPDPRVLEQVEEQRLVWELPPLRGGLVRYDVLHEAPLPAMDEPDLTVVIGGYDVPLQGTLSREDVREARPLEGTQAGWIVEPAADAVLRDSDQTSVVIDAPYPGPVDLEVNEEPVPQDRLGKATYDEMAGRQHLEYYGIALRPGRNLLTVRTPSGTQERFVWLAGAPERLDLVPQSLLADGSTPPTIVVTARDAQGLRSGFGSVTIDTNGVPTGADAFPMEPGYQILLRDGQATLALEPYVHPATLTVRASFNELETTAELHVGGVRAPLVLAHGSVTARFSPAGPRVHGAARAYLETPLGEGTLQAALDTTEPLLPAASGRTDRLPLTGAATNPRPALASEDGVAIRYDTSTSTIGYFQGDVHLPGLEETLHATGLHARTKVEGEAITHTLRGVAALLPDTLITQRITPDGTREYHLDALPLPSGVHAEVTTGEGPDATSRVLTPGRDYVVDAEQGIVRLAAPLWRFDADFEPVVLTVTYAPADAQRSQLAAGAGYEIRGPGGWYAGVGILQNETFRGRVLAGIDTHRANLEAAYAVGTEEAGFTVTGSTNHDAITSAFRIKYDPAAHALQGQAEARAHLTDRTSVNATHARAEGEDTTTLLLEHDLEPFTLAAGVQYDWQESLPYLVGRVAWEDGAARAALTHTQPLEGDAVAVSELRVRYELLDALHLDSGLQYRYGEGLRGSIGITQDLLDSTLTLGYQMAGAAGASDKVRFGVETPLPLSEEWSLHFSAGHEHALRSEERTTAGSLAARYRADDLAASFSADASVSEQDTKLIVRADGTGNLTPDTTFRLSAVLRLAPELSGQFALAHAYRGGNLTTLGAHRLEIRSDAPVLEGEVHPTFHWEGQGQVRSTIAYRLPLDELERGLLQASLGGTVHVLPWLGVGGGVHHLRQTHASRTAWSLEGSARLTPDVWFSAGYTVHGFQGLTNETEGLYIRLDATGGTRE